MHDPKPQTAIYEIFLIYASLFVVAFVIQSGVLYYFLSLFSIVCLVRDQSITECIDSVGRNASRGQYDHLNIMGVLRSIILTMCLLAACHIVDFHAVFGIQKWAHFIPEYGIVIMLCGIMSVAALDGYKRDDRNQMLNDTFIRNCAVSIVSFLLYFLFLNWISRLRLFLSIDGNFDLFLSNFCFHALKIILVFSITLASKWPLSRLFCFQTRSKQHNITYFILGFFLSCLPLLYLNPLFYMYDTRPLLYSYNLMKWSIRDFVFTQGLQLINAILKALVDQLFFSTAMYYSLKVSGFLKNVPRFRGFRERIRYHLPVIIIMSLVFAGATITMVPNLNSGWVSVIRAMGGALELGVVLSSSCLWTQGIWFSWGYHIAYTMLMGIMYHSDKGTMGMYQNNLVISNLSPELSVALILTECAVKCSVVYVASMFCPEPPPKVGGWS